MVVLTWKISRGSHKLEKNIDKDRVYCIMATTKSYLFNVYWRCLGDIPEVMSKGDRSKLKWLNIRYYCVISEHLLKRSIKWIIGEYMLSKFVLTLAQKLNLCDTGARVNRIGYSSLLKGRNFVFVGEENSFGRDFIALFFCFSFQLWVRNYKMYTKCIHFKVYLL